VNQLAIVVAVSVVFGAAFGWLILAGAGRRIFFIFGTDGIVRLLLSAIWNGGVSSALLLGPSFLVFELLGLIPMKPLVVLAWCVSLLFSSAAAKAIRARR
jgi:hypothetical protein